MTDLRAIERSLAYEQASQMVDSSCLLRTAGSDTWIDLASAEIDLSDEVAYLEARGLLMRHGDHPEWVMVCDEGEPCSPVAKEFGEGEASSFRDWLARTEAVQNQILEEIQKMSTNQAQLDTELATVSAEVATLVTAVTTALNDLVAKAASNPTAPVADFTAEFTALQGIATQLSGLQATAAADDPGAPAAAAPAETAAA